MNYFLTIFCSFVLVISQAFYNVEFDLEILSLRSTFPLEGMIVDIEMFAFGKVSLQTNTSSVHFSHVIVSFFRSLTPTCIIMFLVDVFSFVLSKTSIKESIVKPGVQTLFAFGILGGRRIPLMHESPISRCDWPSRTRGGVSV